MKVPAESGQQWFECCRNELLFALLWLFILIQYKAKDKKMFGFYCTNIMAHFHQRQERFTRIKVLIHGDD